jgi:lipopolysaccharide biosynthesis regulator YciM
MNAWWDLSPELASPFTLVFAAVLVCGAILFVAVRRRARRSGRRAPHAFPPASQPLARGFDLLLDAHWQEAAGVLAGAVNADPGRVLEYLELGKLWRRQRDPGRAARMFEHLLARPTLDHAVRIAAQYELGLAYRALGFHAPAAAALAQVLGADASHQEARRELRRTYEEMGQWEMAVAIERRRLKRGEATSPQTLAALRTQQGKVAWAAGDLRASAAHWQAALALDPQCTEASLFLGRLLLRQRRLRKAFRVWDGLAKTSPEFLYLAFRDMQEAFRQLRNEAGWEVCLRTFTERHPGDPAGHLALAEWYAASARAADAMACLRRVLDRQPLCREAHLALIALYRDQGISPEALDAYERLAKEAMWLRCGYFRCRACGHTMGDAFWQCPSCHVWATPERLLPPAGGLPLGLGATPHALGRVSPSTAPIVVAQDAPVHTTAGTSPT